jgi:hypothetical protein
LKILKLGESNLNGNTKSMNIKEMLAINIEINEKVDILVEE